jgi:hypothetical protein
MRRERRPTTPELEFPAASLLISCAIQLRVETKEKTCSRILAADLTREGRQCAAIWFGEGNLQTDGRYRRSVRNIVGYISRWASLEFAVA